MSERPNIRTVADEHRRCRYPGHGPVSTWARAGDVRRCPHGRIQLAYEVPGSVPAYWRDLSPVWDLFTYRRARRALTVAEGTR